jgi:hypothetical protein
MVFENVIISEFHYGQREDRIAAGKPVDDL